MKLRFNNRGTVDAWFDRVTKCNPTDQSLSVYGSNIIGRGHTLYSYGDHFPLARWFPEPGVFLTNTSERRSNSTSRHQSFIRRSCPNNFIEVGWPIRKYDPFTNFDRYVDAFNADILKCLLAVRRSRKYKNVCRAVLNASMQRRNIFVQTFSHNIPELPEDITTALVTLKLAA